MAPEAPLTGVQSLRIVLWKGTFRADNAPCWDEERQAAFKGNFFALRAVVVRGTEACRGGDLAAMAARLAAGADADAKGDGEGRPAAPSAAQRRPEAPSAF